MSFHGSCSAGCRSARSPPPAHVGGAARRGWRWGRRHGRSAPRQGVEHHVAAAQPGGQRLAAGRLDREQAIQRHRTQDGHHLPVAVGGSVQAALHAAQSTRQHPALERGAVAQCARLAGQYRHVVPRVVDGLVAAKAAGMVAHHLAVLADGDTVGIGVHLDRPPDRLRHHRVFVLVEAYQAGLGHRRGAGVEPVEASGIRHQARPLLLEHLPHRAVPTLGMGMAARIQHALLQQPAVHVGEAVEPQAWLEEPPAHHVDLVLDLAFLPTRCRGAGRRLDQVVAAHLGKAAVELPLAPDQQRVHRGAHVVVDAALAGAAVERERPVMRVEHHLLRLARVGAHERHPAVAEPDLRHLNGCRMPAQQHDLGRPVELVGLAGRVAQRDVGIRRAGAALAQTCLGVAAHGVVAAREALGAQVLVDPHQVEPLPAG